MADETPQRKPFAALIQEQRNGGLHGEASDALAELVTKVRETGKGGTLTLTLKVTPNKDGSTVTVTDKVATKLPEGERGAAIFFMDENGNLSRRNPAQVELPFQVVDKPEPAEQEVAS